jgi:hypothetical protein
MRKTGIREKIEFLKILIPMIIKELPSFLLKQLWDDKYWLATMLTFCLLSIFFVVDPLIEYFGIALSTWPYNVAGAVVGMSFLSIKKHFEKAASEKGKIYKIPGWRLGRILRVIYGKRIYERVIEPHLSDYRNEYMEALASKNPKVAIWVWIRCWFALVITAVMQLPLSISRICLELWKLTVR